MKFTTWAEAATVAARMNEIDPAGAWSPCWVAGEPFTVVPFCRGFDFNLFTGFDPETTAEDYLEFPDEHE